MDQLDADGIVSHRLYRQHALPWGPIFVRNDVVFIKSRFYTKRKALQHGFSILVFESKTQVKDLSKLGRNLEQTVIIDNVRENFMFQHDNGIFILPWYHDRNDTALRDLLPLLGEIITKRARVADVLDMYKTDIPLWSGWATPDFGFPEHLEEEQFEMGLLPQDDEDVGEICTPRQKQNSAAPRFKSGLTGAFQAAPACTPQPLRNRRRS